MIKELNLFTQTGSGHFLGSFFHFFPVRLKHVHPFSKRKGGIFVFHLDRAVLDASRLASHVTGVAAAGAAFHLHAGRPDDEVGRGGIHLAPGDLIDGRPHLTDGRQSLLHHCRGAEDTGEG